MKRVWGGAENLSFIFFVFFSSCQKKISDDPFWIPLTHDLDLLSNQSDLFSNGDICVPKEAFNLLMERTIPGMQDALNLHSFSFPSENPSSSDLLRGITGVFTATLFSSELPNG